MFAFALPMGRCSRRGLRSERSNAVGGLSTAPGWRSRLKASYWERDLALLTQFRLLKLVVKWVDYDEYTDLWSTFS